MAAREYISDALNDFDYESNERMSAAIRAKTGLKPWTKKGYIDVLNVAAAYALEPIASKICVSKPMTFDQVRDLLIQEGLPAYFKKYPKEAEELGWKLK